MLGRLFSQLALKIGALVRGGRDPDVADEIRAHIDQLEELYRSEGMSPAGRPDRSDDRVEV